MEPSLCTQLADKSITATMVLLIIDSIYHRRNMGFQVPRTALDSPIPPLPGAPAPAAMAVEPSQGTVPATAEVTAEGEAADGLSEQDTIPAEINSPHAPVGFTMDAVPEEVKPVPMDAVPEPGVAETNPKPSERSHNTHQPEPLAATALLEGDSKNTKAGDNEIMSATRGKGPDLAEFATHSVPPAELTPHAIKNRLRRVFAPRKDGTRMVDERWLEAWNDTYGGGRDEIMAMFEKVGYSPDRV